MLARIASCPTTTAIRWLLVLVKAQRRFERVDKDPGEQPQRQQRRPLLRYRDSGEKEADRSDQVEHEVKHLHCLASLSARFCHERARAAERERSPRPPGPGPRATTSPATGTQRTPPHRSRSPTRVPTGTRRIAATGSRCWDGVPHSQRAAEATLGRGNRVHGYMLASGNATGLVGTGESEPGFAQVGRDG